MSYSFHILPGDVPLSQGEIPQLPSGLKAATSGERRIPSSASLVQILYILLTWFRSRTTRGRKLYFFNSLFLES